MRKKDIEIFGLDKVTNSLIQSKTRRMRKDPTN